MSFKAGDYGDPQITEGLKKELYGRQYDIVFDTLTATLNSLTTHEVLTMKRLQSKVPTYMGSYEKHGIRCDVLIRRTSPMLLRETLTIPPPANSKADTTYIAGQMSIAYGYNRTAYVDSYLTKVD